MPSIVDLQPLLSQQIAIRLDGDQYVLRIYNTTAGVLCDLTRDEVVVIRGIRIVGGTPLIPYTYLQDGNFMLVTADNELPEYTKFGVDQYLIFFTQAELEAL